MSEWRAWCHAPTVSEIPADAVSFGGHTIAIEPYDGWSSAQALGLEPSSPNGVDYIVDLVRWRWNCSCGHALGQSNPARSSEREAHEAWRRHVIRDGGLVHMVREAGL